MKKARKKLDISALAIVDNMVFTKNEVVAYYKLNNNAFDFLSQDQKIASALRISNALNSLMTDKQEPVTCNIIATSVPIDVDAWEVQMENSNTWAKSVSYENFVREQADMLRQREFMKRVFYIGVNIGRRGALDMSDLNILESGFKGAMDTLKTWLNTLMQQPTDEISAQEENFFRVKEREINRILSNGAFGAVRCSTDELLLMLKRPFHPAMPAPRLNVDHSNRIGSGDIALETVGVIENKYRHVKVSQMYGSHEIDGCRAVLTFTNFPKEMTYPNGTFPFLYFPTLFGVPFTTYVHFTMHPNAKMKKELEKKKKEQKDELHNLSNAQTDYDSTVDSMPSDVSESLRDIQTLSVLLAGDKTPWVEGSYRIVVEAPDYETLKDYCSALKQGYEDLGISLLWTAGDQLDLLLEQMPGDHLRNRSFNQITNLAMLATSGFNFGSDVGDRIYDGTNLR